MNATTTSRSIFAFWQHVVMTTLGFGAALLGTVMALEKPLGLTPVTSMLTMPQLALFLVGLGTMGLHIFQDRWCAQGRLPLVRRFAVWTLLVMLIASFAVDLHPHFSNVFVERVLAHIAFGGTFVGVALAHIYLPTYQPPLEPIAVARDDEDAPDE